MSRLRFENPIPAAGFGTHTAVDLRPSDQAERSNSSLEGKAAAAEKGGTYQAENPRIHCTFERYATMCPIQVRDDWIHIGYKPFVTRTVFQLWRPENNRVGFEAIVIDRKAAYSFLPFYIYKRRKRQNVTRFCKKNYFFYKKYCFYIINRIRYK